MPLKFWDEAFLTATYLINLLPSKVIKFETPITRLLGISPDYKSLRVFGCACWPNLRPYNSRKLAFHSKRCVFLGYSPIHKGVKCLDVSTGRVYISRDVVFDESIFPFASLHPNAGAILKKEILLLPPNLRNFEQGGDDCTDQYDTSTSSSGAFIPVQGHGENGGENDAQNDQDLAPNGPILHVLEEEEAGAGYEVDPEQPATPQRQVSLDRVQRPTLDRAPIRAQRQHATSPGSGPAQRPTCGWPTTIGFQPETVGSGLHAIGSGLRLPTRADQATATPTGSSASRGATAPESSVNTPEATESGSGSATQSGSRESASSGSSVARSSVQLQPVPASRVTTRLQKGIKKIQKLEQMVLYAMACCVLQESQLDWKMHLEIQGGKMQWMKSTLHS